MKRKPAKSSAKKTKAKATVRDLKPRKHVKGGTFTKAPGSVSGFGIEREFKTGGD